MACSLRSRQSCRTRILIGLVLADTLLDDRHLPLLQLADDAVIDVLLRDAADQLLADPLELGLGQAASLPCRA